MISLSNPHPISSFLFKRNNFYSPKLYVKESSFRRREKEIATSIVTATAFASSVLLLVVAYTYIR